MKPCRTILLTFLLMVVAFPAWAMEQHTEVLRDQYGRAIGGATVSVYNAGTSVLATIYSDNGSTAKSNPFLTNALDGSFSFYASNGVYDITFAYPGVTFDASRTRRISLFDVNDFSGGGGGGTASCYKSVTDTSYTVVAADNNCVVEFSNASGVSVTLPQAGTSGFTATFRFTALNRGAGDVVITPTTSTIQGDTDLTLTTGQSTDIQSDGTNYVYTPGIVPATGWPQTTTTPAYTSEASPVKVCGLVLLTDDCYYIYVHSNGKPIIRGVRNGVEGDLDIEVVIDSGNKWFVSDSSGNMIVQIEPGASGRLKYTFGSSYRLTKSILLTADALYMHGCTLTTDSALITGGLTEPYITCGDNDSHGFHRSLVLPLNWAADTITVTQYLTNVNATPSATVYEIDYSAECEANSEVIGSSISSTGEQPATVNFANSGTCGTACAQFDLTIVTTAAITPNGTCAGGNLFRIQGNVDATATTSAQVADIKLIAIKVNFNLSSWGE